MEKKKKNTLGVFYLFIFGSILKESKNTTEIAEKCY